MLHRLLPFPSLPFSLSLQIFMSCLTATFSLASVLPNLQSFAEASGSGAYVFEIIERQSKIDVTIEQGDIPSTFTGDIEFQNVHFTYPSRKEAPVGHSLCSPSCLTVPSDSSRFSTV